MDSPSRIPVTVIGGFLGAGKTTLVNHLLRHTPHRTGVIVNEFGTADVDGGLIEALAQDPGDVHELTAGCLCCSSRDDLIRALVLLAQRGQTGSGAPQQVLIELSGVADPVPVLHTLLDPDVRRVFRLDSLIAVADARHLPLTLRDHPETALQLAYATRIVLNKTDLVTPDELTAATQLAVNLAPLARVLHAQRGAVSPEDLLNTQDFSAQWTPPAAHTQHTPGLKAVTLEAGEPLSAHGWQAFVERIVSRPGQVLRVKGHVQVHGHPNRLHLQAVRDVLSVDDTGEHGDGRSQLVLIGRDLHPAEEREAFARCAALGQPRILPRVPRKQGPQA